MAQVTECANKSWTVQNMEDKEIAISQLKAIVEEVVLGKGKCEIVLAIKHRLPQLTPSG